MSQAVKNLIAEVKKNDFYVPRDYKTIGGMWTVDTWRRNGVEVKLMDEGYTTVVIAKDLRVITGFNGKEYINYELGDEEKVNSILSDFKNIAS